MTLPNRLTAIRIAAAVALFVVLELLRRAAGGSELLGPWRVGLAWAGLVLFLLAALTDVLDGYFARRRGSTSIFGRIADPFADKILVCGALVFLANTRGVMEVIQPWVVVVILAREFLVSGLRSYVEGQGRSFSARSVGKLKMFLQCVLVGAALFRLGPGHAMAGLPGILLVVTTLTLVVTVWSGWVYLRAARALTHAPPAGEGPGA